MKPLFSDNVDKLISQIEEMNRRAMKTILTFGEMSMPETQFKAFRRVVLDLYGMKGLQRSVRDVVSRSFGISILRAGAPDSKGQTQGKRGVGMR